MFLERNCILILQPANTECQTATQKMTSQLSSTCQFSYIAKLRALSVNHFCINCYAFLDGIKNIHFREEWQKSTVTV